MVKKNKLEYKDNQPERVQKWAWVWIFSVKALVSTFLGACWHLLLTFEFEDVQNEKCQHLMGSRNQRCRPGTPHAVQSQPLLRCCRRKWTIKTALTHGINSKIAIKIHTSNRFALFPFCENGRKLIRLFFFFWLCRWGYNANAL